MYTNAQKMKQVLMEEPNIYELMKGGIYTFEDTGRLGITFTNTPQAFKGARLLPCMVVKTFSTTPTLDVRDEDEQIMSFEQIGHIYIYQEGGYDIIEETFKWVYNQLQDRRPFENKPCIITNMPEGRQDESLNGASYIRVDYRIYGLQQPETQL